MPGQLSGAGAIQQGYQNSLNTLAQNQSLAQNTTSGQEQQLAQQLKQNQGATQQGLINSGLGNTTVAQTMQQAPLQTYNQSLANVQNQGALTQMSANNQLASAQANQGQQMAQYLAQMQQLAQQGNQNKPLNITQPGQLP